MATRAGPCVVADNAHQPAPDAGAAPRKAQAMTSKVNTLWWLAMLGTYHMLPPQLYIRDTESLEAVAPLQRGCLSAR